MAPKQADDIFSNQGSRSMKFQKHHFGPKSLLVRMDFSEYL